MGGFSLLLVAARARLKMIEGIRAVEFLSIFVIGQMWESCNLFRYLCNTYHLVYLNLWILNQTITIMNNLFRGLLSGYGAMKLGGGCLGTIVIFVVIWVLLGKCSWNLNFVISISHELFFRGAMATIKKDSL